MSRQFKKVRRKFSTGLRVVGRNIHPSPIAISVRGQPRQRHIDERFTIRSAIDATKVPVLFDHAAKRDQGRDSVGQKLHFQDGRRSGRRGAYRTPSSASASKNDRKLRHDYLAKHTGAR